MNSLDATIEEMHNEIEECAKHLKTWKCNLFFNEADSMEEEPILIDLCKYLFPPTQHNPAYPGGSNYIFPRRFQGESSRNQLVAELKIAAIKCGFSLIITSSTKKPSSIKSERGMQVRLGCASSIAYKPYCGETAAENEKTTEPYAVEEETLNNKTFRERKVTYTKRAVHTEDTCSFAFVIFMQKETSSLFPHRWFLAYRKGLDGILQCNHHSNHFKLDANMIPVSTNLLSDEEKKLLKDCSQLYMTSSATASLLSQSVSEQTGIGWSSKQVYWLTYKERREIADLSPDASSAMKLIQSFDER
jgi:hypothetical protein